MRLDIEAKQLSRDETKHSRGVAETPQASWPEMENIRRRSCQIRMIEKERKWQQTAEKLKNLFYDLGNKARRIWDKIKAVYRRIMKIPADLENLSRKKDALCDKIDWWKAFIGHPRTQKAISLVKTRAFRLLWHVFSDESGGRTCI